MTKAKRIKKVFTSHDQVLHLWIHQTQEDARTKNVYFHKESCYSYGSHYELGRLMTYKGVKVAAINNRGYSNTTSKHIRSAFSAATGVYPAIGCKGDFTAAGIFAGLLVEQESIVSRLMSHFSTIRPERDPKHSYWSAEYNWTRDQVKSFNKLVTDLKEPQLKIEINQDFINLYNQKVDALHEKYLYSTTDEFKAEQVKKESKREAALLKKAETDLTQWKNGGQLLQSLRSLPFQLIRINGDKVQTTLGAEVPLVDARRFYIALKNKAIKAGTKIGPFTYENTNEGVLKIGCHKIKVSEVESVLGGV